MNLPIYDGVNQVLSLPSSVIRQEKKSNILVCLVTYKDRELLFLPIGVTRTLFYYFFRHRKMVEGCSDHSGQTKLSYWFFPRRLPVYGEL